MQGGICTENTDGLLNLLKNVPESIKVKLAQASNNESILKGKVELIVLVSGSIEKVKLQVQDLGGSVENLGYGFAIITVNYNLVENVAQIKEILYMELPKNLYISFIGSNNASCVPFVWDTFKLTGEGVLVGFIDSGIDYLHPAFKDDEKNTRIDYIYDLSKQGKVWTKDDINKAIKSSNPLAIVDETDDIGHGTHVAGTACGNGNIDKRYYGVAYKSSIAMVKMTGEGKINYGRSTQLMRGIKFLIEKSIELNKPLVINLSFSTNDGAHDGSSLLEKYISTVTDYERISFVVASGNEGAAAHHVGGVLRNTQTISMNIAPDERSLVLQLYKSFTSNIKIEIKNPQEKSSGIFNIKQGYIEGNIDNDKIYIYNSGPKPFSKNGEIVISIVSNEQYIISGVWKITIYDEENSKGNYNIWMPVAEGLNQNTKFLQPNPYNTLGIPATVENVISVGSYNHISNAISIFSGRGKENGCIVKPDLCAPGENIESAIPMGGYDSLTGTSMATPHVSGSLALMMEWGIVRKNDPYLYGQRLKYYLLKGATRDRLDVTYPDPLWGYGKLCLEEVMNLITGKRGKYRQNENLNIKCDDVYTREDYKNFIVEYQGDIVASVNKLNYACAFILDERLAVISVQYGKEEELFKNIKEIVNVEPPSIYTLCSISPLETANILKFHDNGYLTLRGKGVLVGIVDTGIDYLNKQFQYEDDTTRIVSIWDQTSKKGKQPEEFVFGTEYSSAEINEAITLSKKGQDPKTIVDSEDTNGHGTAMAGIIGARGRDGGIVGAAPDCEFVVVKLKQAKKVALEENGVLQAKCEVYENTDLILGLKYLYLKARKLKKPMALYIPVSTNNGAHDGSSIIERYVDEISKTRGGAVVTGCGNEGDTDTHTEGIIVKKGDVKSIELNIDELQKDLNFEIWCKKPDKISVSIVSPSGEVIEKIPAKIQETEEIKFIFEGTSVFIKYYLPEESTGDELIEIKMRNLSKGIWKFNLIGDYIVDGSYDAWIPQRILLSGETRFLNPTQYTTLTVPSTSRMILSSAYYNQNNNTLSSKSGRGFTRDNRVKPDLASGGIDVITTAPNNETQTVSGSSVGGAVLTGAVALMLGWGIVEGNDPTMYSTKIKNYLIRGTKKRQGDVYPNSELGYGILDLNGVFENIRSAKPQNKEVYISIPREIMNRLL